VNAAAIAEFWVSTPNCHPDLKACPNALVNGGLKSSSARITPQGCTWLELRLRRLEQAEHNLVSIALEAAICESAVQLCFYRWRTEALSSKSCQRHAVTRLSNARGKPVSNEVMNRQERRVMAISRMQKYEDTNFGRVCLLRWHHLVFQDASARWKAVVQGGLQGGLGEIMRDSKGMEDRLAEVEAIAQKAARFAEAAEQRAEQACAVAKEVALQAKCLDSNIRAVGSIGPARGSNSAVGRTKSAGTGGTGGRADGTAADAGIEGSRGGTDGNHEDCATLSMEANLVRAETRCLELRKQLEGAERELVHSREDFESRKELNRRSDPMLWSNRSAQCSARRSPSPMMRLGHSLEAPIRRTPPVTPHGSLHSPPCALTPPQRHPGSSASTVAAPPAVQPTAVQPTTPTHAGRPIALPMAPIGTWNTMGSISTSSSARVKSPQPMSIISPPTPAAASPAQAYRKVDSTSHKRATSPMHGHAQLPAASGMSARQNGEVGNCFSPPQPMPSKMLQRSVLVRGPSSNTIQMKPGSPRFPAAGAAGSSASTLPGSLVVPARVANGGSTSPSRKAVTPTRSPAAPQGREVQVPPWAAAHPTKMDASMPSIQVGPPRHTVVPQPKSVRGMLGHSSTPTMMFDANLPLDGASPQSTFRINTER